MKNEGEGNRGKGAYGGVYSEREGQEKGDRSLKDGI